jgi:hypothetical protein
MNVGILSMQRVKNWGSFLQAFALKKTIESLGHDCSFLDIKPCVGLNKNELIELNKKNAVKFLFKRIFRILSCIARGQFLARIKGRAFQRKFSSKYDTLFLPMLGIDPNKYEDDKVFDVVVIGSDEVFNCTQNSPWCRTMQLFGEGVTAKKIITYAASFGYTDLSALKKYGLESRVKKALENISSFSVRDMNSYSMIEQLTGKKAELCVDPVIMFDFSSYMPPKVPMKDYLVVYTYYTRLEDPEIIKAIRNFAASKNKAIVSLFCYYNWCDHSILADTPFELLSYFANADYVVTDTFHGTVFSIKYNKNFVTMVKKNNAQKLKSLLDQFKLTNRIVTAPIEIKCKLEQGIDYTQTNEVINAETLKAKTYLKEAIQIEN